MVKKPWPPGVVPVLSPALYILFDAVIPSANVLGNGAFAKMIDRIMGALKSSKGAIEKG